MQARKRSNVLRATVVGAAAAVMALSAAGVANATQFNGVCEYKEVCLYKDSYLRNAYIDHQYADPNYFNNTWMTVDPAQSTNDQVSSMQSFDPDWKVRFFTDAYYGGYWQTLGTNTTDNQANYNDMYSSHCWNDGGVSGYAQCDF